MIKVLGWLLLLPSIGYLVVQCVFFIDWLVVRDSTVSWNITLLITSFLVAMAGEGLREYGKHRQVKEANNADK